MELAHHAGAELEYTIAGAGDPVVFIHGALIAGIFSLLAREPSLSESYRLILYHRRGYGGSSRGAGTVTVGEQAADCLELLRQLGVEQAHVVGHSYGGTVALQLALDAPEMVQTLALLEPALMVGTNADGYRTSLRDAASRFRELGAERAVDAFLSARLPEYRVLLDRLPPGVFEQAVADASTSFDQELPGLLDWRFGADEARRIRLPVLSVLGGESNAGWPRFGETHRLLLEWLPNGEGFVLPGTTHFMPLEDPRGLAEALAEFFSRHH